MKISTRPADVVPLTEAEREILQTLRDLRYSPAAVVRTRIIADALYKDIKTVQYHVRKMVRKNVVWRPLGRCSGVAERHYPPTEEQKEPVRTCA